MSNDTDYYKVLGLVPGAEIAVIKAAYRALVAIYHPDKNDTQEAQQKIRTINIAYETLSDPTKRKEYDKNRAQQAHNANYSEFDCEKPFDITHLDKAWSIAISFYPRIGYQFEDLAKISWRLAFAFKLQLLDGQEYLNSMEISNQLKSDYLTRYFGKNHEVRSLAEHLIKARELQAALYLNDIINVMGESININSIRNKVNEKYPNIIPEVEKRLLYERAKDYYGSYAAEQLIRLHGGDVKSKFFSSKKIVTLDGQQRTFKNDDEFRRYVVSHFKEQYA